MVFGCFLGGVFLFIYFIFKCSGLVLFVLLCYLYFYWFFLKFFWFGKSGWCFVGSLPLLAQAFYLDPLLGVFYWLLVKNNHRHPLSTGFCSSLSTGPFAMAPALPKSEVASADDAADKEKGEEKDRYSDVGP